MTGPKRSGVHTGKSEHGKVKNTRSKQTNLETLDSAAQTQANLLLLGRLGDFHTEKLFLGPITVVPNNKRGMTMREH
jgi:hypothetical protein